jgi:3-deoxy-D-manno-octulosonate 8-phosphate phosphatase (KDO 8-P phosphatase)
MKAAIFLMALFLPSLICVALSVTLQSSRTLFINMHANLSLEDYFNGEFVTNPLTLKQKLRQVKAFIFDWDGVFNNGEKNIAGDSGFSEIDSMGINMMRFCHTLQNKQLPITAIITGENNKLAFSFAERENFNAVYYKMVNKEKALMHLCEQYKLSPADVMFVFDDVLDLAAAKLAGVKFMIGRTCNPLLIKYATDNRLVDYITKHDGSNNAIREVSEMVMTFSNNYNLTIEHRIRFSEVYQSYIRQRTTITPELFTLKDNAIIQP